MNITDYIQSHDFQCMGETDYNCEEDDLPPVLESYCLGGFGDHPCCDVWWSAKKTDVEDSFQ